MLFTIFLRRIQRFLLPIKIVSLIILISCLIFLIINVPPGIGAITLFAVLLFLLLAIILSFFQGSKVSLFISLAISFLLFLRVVDLFTIINFVLLALFLVLLGLYLRKK